MNISPYRTNGGLESPPYNIYIYFSGSLKDNFMVGLSTHPTRRYFTIYQ
ncbi:MAG: hypothetical protein IKZ88_07455 [Neisseriaceae bacterium]|nr:hypothetical protein [Neisseriaceae bacterium]